jgi:hypothetical protein
MKKIALAVLAAGLAAGCGRREMAEPVTSTYQGFHKDGASYVLVFDDEKKDERTGRPDLIAFGNPRSFTIGEEYTVESTAKGRLGPGRIVGAEYADSRK